MPKNPRGSIVWYLQQKNIYYFVIVNKYLEKRLTFWTWIPSKLELELFACISQHYSYVMLFVICYYLDNLKNVKSTHEGVLLLVKLRAFCIVYSMRNRKVSKIWELLIQQYVAAFSKLEITILINVTNNHDVIDVVLVFLLLNLNIFYIFF